MLEIVNLKKTYKSKKGGNTDALKGISLKFPDTGLVFVLGKSGCGKSTLLNLLGGLDVFDSGEIIINGKSSKDFTRSDFDSYRNTYLGFVFQEFNIIENFTIEKNIALALQLQHKKGEKSEISEILKKVDLEGFGKRKPNELSGGQKQRVAIARALIKDPEIILADEPTGALDSQTGKSVLNTLRLLSKEKLVIIVSHDREFAEEYADRIVELKDGLVISDRSRAVSNGQDVSLKDEIIPIDKNIIRIPKGKPMDALTIDSINNSLLNSKQDTFLLLTDERNAERAYPDTMAKVKENGFVSENTFFETDEKKIKSDKQALSLIKSQLPLADAFKIGISNFKSKKFRLVLTIFLSVLSLCFFGFADIFASYDKAETYTKAFYQGNAYYMAITKTKEITEYDYTYSTPVPLSKEDIAYLKENLNNDILCSYGFPSYSENVNFFKTNNDSFFSPRSYNGFLEMAKNDDIVAYGSFPESFDEVMISDHMAKAYVELSLGVQTSSGYEEFVFPSYDQLIGYELTLSGKTYKICGIFKTNYYVYEEYFKGRTQAHTYTDKELSAKVQCYNSDNNLYYGKVIVKNGFADNFSKSLSSYTNNGLIVDFSQQTQTEEYVYKEALAIYVDDSGTLKKGQIVVPAQYYSQIKYGWESKKTLDELKLEFASPQNITCYVPLVRWGGSNERIFEKVYDVVGITGEVYIYDDFGPTPVFKNALYSDVKPMDSITIPGDMGNYCVYMCREDFNELMDVLYTPDSILTTAALSGEELHETLTMLIDNGYAMTGRNDGELSMVDGLMKPLLQVFYIVSGSLAVFVMLLIYNFISTSIVNKKKEIGILRAIGARGVDIGNIFLFESLMIGAIILVIAFPTVIILSGVLQDLLLSAIPIQIISFKLRQVFTMTGITLAILFISSIIPVSKISRKRPIDAILDK